MNNIVQVKDLNFSYNEKKIFQNCNLDVKEKEFLCLIGPNGCGKSTFLKILANYIAIEKNVISIMGCDVNSTSEKKKKISLVSENISLPEYFTVYELLMFSTRCSNIDKSEGEKIANEIIEIFELKKHKKTFIKNLSTGLRRKVILADSFINSNKILLLDEPTNALDQKSSKELREMFKKINREGTTIIYVSHLLDEIESMYTSIGMVKNEKIYVYNRSDFDTTSNSIFINITSEKDQKQVGNFLNDKGIKYKEYINLIQIPNFNAFDSILKSLEERKIKYHNVFAGKLSLKILHESMILEEGE